MHKRKMFLIGLVVVCCLCVTAAFAQAPNGQQEVTFKLNSLTKSPVHIQHGIKTIIVVNMIDKENPGQLISIDDPPQFPLISTLEYETVKGQKRKVSSAYGYRC